MLDQLWGYGDILPMAAHGVPTALKLGAIGILCEDVQVWAPCTQLSYANEP